MKVQAFESIVALLARVRLVCYVPVVEPSQISRFEGYSVVDTDPAGRIDKGPLNPFSTRKVAPQAFLPLSPQVGRSYDPLSSPLSGRSFHVFPCRALSCTYAT